MNPSNAIPRFHLSLPVRDLAASRAFYDLLFKQEPVKVMPGYLKYQLEEPRAVISFVESKDVPAEPAGHLGIQLGSTEEVLAEAGRLRQANLPLLEEEQVRCCYALQDKFWVRDPDGYRWEIYTFHRDIEENDAHYRLGEEASVVSDPVASAGRKCC